MKHPLGAQSHSLFLRVFAFVVLGTAAFHAWPANAATDAAARVVKYSKEDIVPVRAKLKTTRTASRKSPKSTISRS